MTKINGSKSLLLMALLQTLRVSMPVEDSTHLLFTKPVSTTKERKREDDEDDDKDDEDDDNEYNEYKEYKQQIKKDNKIVNLKIKK